AKRLDGPPLGCRGLRRNRKELPPHHGLPTTLDAKSGSRRISRQRVVCQPTKVRITCSHSRGASIPTFYCGWDIIKKKFRRTGSKRRRALLRCSERLSEYEAR